jgi:hypothetical protein
VTEPHAFLAIDRGAATSSVGLIGRVAGAWRLIGGLGVPAGADLERAIDLLAARTLAADAELAEVLGVTPDVERLPRVEVRSSRPRRLAIVAASQRILSTLTAVAARSAWRTSGGSVESTDPLAMTRLLLEPDVDAILAGAGDPPGPEERRAVGELTALLVAVAQRRPDVPIVLAGAMAEGIGAFGDLGARPGEVLLAPAARAGAPGGGPLADLLAALALPADDARHAIGAATQTLADVLDRRVEAIVLGHDASVRAVAAPTGAGSEVTADVAIVPAAAVAPDEPDDAVVDGVLHWSTIPSDRHRLRDRMRELRIAPWADAAGEGTALRMAATRAALVRLRDATPDLGQGPPPDIVVTASGAWSSVPAPTVSLAIVDVLRRPGASQFALDHARLLAPLGSIPDEGERRAVMSDLGDDLLAPLGSVITPAGLRAGKTAGSLLVHGQAGAGQLDLVPGGIELVDLAPGQTAIAEFRFRDSVRLGAKGRHFAIDVAGGLGGLLVDLRDVPLRLPERADRRRDLLTAWQTALWAGADA